MNRMYGLVVVDFALLFLASVLTFFQRGRTKNKGKWSKLDTTEVVILVFWWSLFVSLAVIGQIVGFFGWGWWQALTIYLGSFIWASVVFFIRWKGEFLIYLIATVPFFIYFFLIFLNSIFKH